MVRGTTLFVCRHCGCRFRALDIEWQATALSMPMPCPECGGMRTRPVRLGVPSLSDMPYKPIWGRMDEKTEKK